MVYNVSSANSMGTVDEDAATAAMPMAEPSIDGMIRAKQQPSQFRGPTDIHHPILGMAPAAFPAVAKAASGECIFEQRESFLSGYIHTYLKGHHCTPGRVHAFPNSLFILL